MNRIIHPIGLVIALALHLAPAAAQTQTQPNVLNILSPCAVNVPIVSNGSGVPVKCAASVTALRLLGNPTGSAATQSEISLGSTLIFSGSALQTAAFSGDFTSSANSFAGTLNAVNGNVGSFGSATQVPQFTVNGKGLITAVANVTVTPAIGSLTGAGSGVLTALGINVGSVGAFVTNGGALGTPSSGVGTNITGVNAATLSGATFAAPGAIGGGTPAAGTFTALTFNTVITGPLHIGGGGTLGTQLTLQTTSGNGTTDAMTFLGGNNGGTTFATLNAVGLGLGTAPAQLFTGSINSTTLNGSKLQNTNSGGVVSWQAQNDGGVTGEFGVRGSARASYGTLVANDVYLYSTSTTGITFMADSASGVMKWATGGNTLKMQLSAAGGLGLNTASDPGAGMVYTNAATFMLRTKTSLSNGAAAAAGTLTNAPAAGNPTKWLPYDDNGTTRYIPAW